MNSAYLSVHTSIPVFTQGLTHFKMLDAHDTKLFLKITFIYIEANFKFCLY